MGHGTRKPPVRVLEGVFGSSQGGIGSKFFDLLSFFDVSLIGIILEPVLLSPLHWTLQARVDELAKEQKAAQRALEEKLDKLTDLLRGALCAQARSGEFHGIGGAQQSLYKASHLALTPDDAAHGSENRLHGRAGGGRVPETVPALRQLRSVEVGSSVVRPEPDVVTSSDTPTERTLCS